MNGVITTDLPLSQKNERLSEQCWFFHLPVLSISIQFFFLLLPSFLPARLSGVRRATSSSPPCSSNTPVAKFSDVHKPVYSPTHLHVPSILLAPIQILFNLSKTVENILNEIFWVQIYVRCKIMYPVFLRIFCFTVTAVLQLFFGIQDSSYCKYTNIIVVGNVAAIWDFSTIQGLQLLRFQDRFGSRVLVAHKPSSHGQPWSNLFSTPGVSTAFYY